jgi:hypothetical protein
MCINVSRNTAPPCNIGLHASSQHCPKIMRFIFCDVRPCGFVGLNPTRGMDVCLRLFCFCYPTDPPSKESCRLCIRLRNWKSGQGSTMGCRAIIISIRLLIFTGVKSRLYQGPLNEVVSLDEISDSDLSNPVEQTCQQQYESIMDFTRSRTPDLPACSIMP